MKKNIIKKFKFFRENGINRQYFLKLFITSVISIFLFQTLLSKPPTPKSIRTIPKNHQALIISLRFSIELALPVTGHLYESDRLIARNIIVARQNQDNKFLVYIPNDQLSNLMKINNQSVLSFFTVQLNPKKTHTYKRKSYEVYY